MIDLIGKFVLIQHPVIDAKTILARVENAEGDCVSVSYFSSALETFCLNPRVQKAAAICCVIDEDLTLGEIGELSAALHASYQQMETVINSAKSKYLSDISKVLDAVKKDR